MKIILLVSIIASMIILPLQGRLTLSLASNLNYDSNVFQLSPYDLNRYDAGNSDFAYIKSPDDIIWSSSLRMQYQYRWNQFRFRPYVKVAANRFLLNVDKSNVNYLGNLSILNPKGNIELAYGYYPDNYLRKYNDKDGTGLPEKFTYDKNLYKADATIPLMKHESLYFYLKYEQYYYNKYFTEYNGHALTPGIGWKHSSPQFSFDGTYYYRKLTGDSEIDYSIDTADAAYESNIYAVGMTWKNWKPILASKIINIRPSIGITLENRYYQGSNKFHAGRNDTIIDLTAGLSIPVQKNLDISLDFSHTMRNVSSTYLSVPRYKEYTEDSISAGFSYSFDLMQ
jgi:hypothetical protein